MSWIPSFFRRNKLYSDLNEEIRLHIEERAEQLMSEGMNRAEAEQAARRAFGNRTLVEERSREVWQWPTLESIWSDLRFSVRQLRRSPGFATAAILTLALAIGANALVFAVMNALFLRPVNVPHGESLYALQRGNDTYITQSYPDYVDLARSQSQLRRACGVRHFSGGARHGKDPISVWGYSTSGNYFDALGIQPHLGRFFHSSDEHGPNSAPYMVLTYGYWQSHFQGDRNIVGRQGPAQQASLHHHRGCSAGVPRHPVVLLAELLRSARPWRRNQRSEYAECARHSIGV